MKKLTEEQKRHLLARGRDEAKKKKRIGKERIIIPVNAVYVNQARKKIRQPKVFNRPAPVIFNLKYENCEAVIEYVNDIKSAAARKWNILVDLSRVTEILEGGIAMMLSVTTEVAERRLQVGGNFPYAPEARLVLERSGFFDHVSLVGGQKPIHADTNFMRSGKGEGRGFLKAQIEKAMDTVWGQAGRCPTLRNTIYEMMRNSCDHAFQNAPSSLYRWHFSMCFDVTNRIVKFSFVDNGEGIPNTLVKNFDVKDLFSSDVDMLEAAFHGERESRTRLPWRGKGLPSIYEAFEDGVIRNLLVISNGVFLHFDRAIKEKLRNPYRGTYYYWEVNADCKKEVFR